MIGYALEGHSEGFVQKYFFGVLFAAEPFPLSRAAPISKGRAEKYTWISLGPYDKIWFMKADQFR